MGSKGVIIPVEINIKESAVMSFFEEAVSAAKTVGKTVSKKTEELLIISKKKLEAVELENKISKNYEKLGRLYFESVKFESDFSEEEVEDREDIVNETSQLIEKLALLKNELEELSKNGNKA